MTEPAEQETPVLIPDGFEDDYGNGQLYFAADTSEAEW